MPVRPQCRSHQAAEWKLHGPEGRDALEAHVNGCDECLTRLEAIRRAQPADMRLLVELLVHPPKVSGENTDQPARNSCANASARRNGAPLPSFAG